ncbi:MAG: hypothetical protein ACYDGM_01760 [Vulcanimicrobiaceae bacterium]
MRKRAGLDGRHRDEDGEIHAKRDDTLVRTLRKTYGDDFLPGIRADATLGTVLKKTGAESLTALVKKHNR